MHGRNFGSHWKNLKQYKTYLPKSSTFFCPNFSSPFLNKMAPSTSGFQRSFQCHLHEKESLINILKDNEFSKSREVLATKRKNLVRQGKGNCPNQVKLPSWILQSVSKPPFQRHVRSRCSFLSCHKSPMKTKWQTMVYNYLDRPLTTQQNVFTVQQIQPQAIFSGAHID